MVRRQYGNYVKVDDLMDEEAIRYMIAEMREIAKGKNVRKGYIIMHSSEVNDGLGATISWKAEVEEDDG